MEREKFLLEDNVGLGIEPDPLTGDWQKAVVLDFREDAVDGVGLHGFRVVTRQTHRDGQIRGVSFAGERQRAVEIYPKMCIVHSETIFDASAHELTPGFPWTQCVRGGWSHTYLEHVENTDEFHNDVPISIITMRHAVKKWIGRKESFPIFSPDWLLNIKTIFLVE